MLTGVTNENPGESRKERARRRAGEFPPPPEPLRVPVLDSHTHLDLTLTGDGTGGPTDIASAIALARAAGVDRLVQVGVDVDSSRWGVDVAAGHKAVVATVALHPNEAPRIPAGRLDEALAAECVRRGYVLSFAGTVTFASAGDLRAAAARTPPEQMLVETDAPYLTPMPHRGRPNASYLIPLTVRALARVKHIEVDALCAAISATGERVFGLW